MTPETTAERVSRMDEDGRKQFDQWLSDPQTKFMISLIPSTRDALLWMAFRAGKGCGSGQVIGEMLQSILLSERDKNKPK